MPLKHKPVNNFETNEDILIKFFLVDPHDFWLMNIDRFEKKNPGAFPSSPNKFPLVKEHPNAMSDLRVGREIKTILDISCFHCCHMIGKKVSWHRHYLYKYALAHRGRVILNVHTLVPSLQFVQMGSILQSETLNLTAKCSQYVPITEDGRSHDYFLLLLCKSSIWFTEQHIFKIIIYFSNTSKFATNYVISFEIYDGFILSSL